MQQQRKQRNNAARLGARGALLLFLLASASVAHASTKNGTIDSAHKYAFSNVGGYVNFGTAYGGVSITDSGLSGYAWSANDGWINLAPVESGVKNNGNGTLSGFAWDSSAGWVNFVGVTVDSSGTFHGTATGGQVNGASYAINFDCANCSVVTDWRPASSRPSFDGGGCAPGFVWNPVTISCLPAVGGPYSPVITPPPPSASSTAPTAPASGLPTGSLPSPSPSAGPATSGTATNGQGFVSNPSLTSTTTTFNTVSTSSAIHTATTTAKQTVASSFLDSIGLVGWTIIVSVIILIIGIILFRFL